jgi:competence protein ComEA
MSFLDEVDSLKQKAGIANPKLPIIAFLGAILILIVFVVLGTIWTSVTTPYKDSSVGNNSDEMVVSQSENSDSEGANEANTSTLFVHIAGSVKNPGLYELPQGSRVSDAVSAAGGMSEDANTSSVNLARQLTDGEQIIVASNEDILAATETGTSNGSPSGQVSSQGKVNINTASAEELMTLDGVGEATADKIIAYRQENGSFSRIEEIKEVSGIGEKKFEAMKDAITV